MIKIRCEYWGGSEFVTRYISKDEGGNPLIQESACRLAGELAWEHPGFKTSIVRDTEVSLDGLLFDDPDEDQDSEVAPPKRRRK